MALRRARSQSALQALQRDGDTVGLGIRLARSTAPPPHAGHTRSLTLSASDVALFTEQDRPLTPAAAYAHKHSKRNCPMSFPDEDIFALSSFSKSNSTGLARQGTLLSSSADPRELAVLLGKGSTGRLRPRAQTLPRSLSAPYSRGHLMDSPITTDSVRLEQARPRTRVGLDLRLENDVSVEGGAIRGKVELDVRRAGTWIAGAKLRVIGFEELTAPSLRHVFYQHTRAFSETASEYTLVFDESSATDEDGFRLAKTGPFRIPFEMVLPIGGGAKGVFKNKQGEVRYIIIISFKLKYGTVTSLNSSQERSIAHFFRPLSLYPMLPTISTVLVPLHKPLTGTVERGMLLAGRGKVILCASIERGIWISGCKIWVKVQVSNGCTKKVKSLSLSLVRTVSSFRPKANDLPGPQHEAHDIYMVARSSRVISTSQLSSGDKASRRQHASARGWFLGVPAGETEDLCWSVTIPPEEVSLVRSRLLEVSHSVKVVIDCGGPGGQLDAELPVMIVSGVSMDPPPGQKLLQTSVPQKRSALSDSNHGIPFFKHEASLGSEFGTVHRRASASFRPLAPRTADLPRSSETNILLSELEGLLLKSLREAEMQRERVYIGDLDWHEQARLQNEDIETYARSTQGYLPEKDPGPSRQQHAMCLSEEPPPTLSSYTPSMHISDLECLPASSSHSTPTSNMGATSSSTRNERDAGGHDFSSECSPSECCSAPVCLSLPSNVAPGEENAGALWADRLHQRPLPGVSAPAAGAQYIPRSPPSALHPSFPSRLALHPLSLSPETAVPPNRNGSSSQHRNSLLADSLVSENSVRAKIARLEFVEKATQERRQSPGVLSRSSITISPPSFHASENGLSSP